MDYKQIQEISKEMKAIDFRGNAYVPVNERIKALKKLKPESRITTEILNFSEDGVLIKASVLDENNNIIGTGHAHEERSSKGVNSTSFVENAESSAIGRAIAIAYGLGIDTAICSLDEVKNAVIRQEVESAIDRLEHTAAEEKPKQQKKLWIPKDEVSKEMYDQVKAAGLDWNDIRKWAVKKELTYRNLNDDIVQLALDNIDEIKGFPF